ncbi:YybH family protein [Actinomadura madurae]|uniref:YybH family protein n=1 Tax=Actinomadura madurae TaxID=1993 RepID=UPI0020D1FDF3|nr:SgcJ/EcaC family oxidoreductase [Actinomadura madurae]MCP9952373.1 SgcJ/EcaC family oxidoreductase [Actinomadura madurae]MCP9969141.1 SgcJ/EcaC family oxidoreductase [Actinomadura madurae]MCP9981613.1 SgcJ/EcaC family oxidoreductase [Actinomadura madurae]MCQ0006882.1 SgcJ/EcaC family oxidoreductase [Actinomadura madurae]MCQ0017813.1 SgcJ/EcaC family oxidoreductase [Actinomadura madurae]
MTGRIDAERLAAVEQVVAQAEQHQNVLEPFLALHTAEAVIVNVAGRRVPGRDALRQVRRQALAGPLAQVRTRPEIVDVRFAAPNVAIVSCVKHISDERDPAARRDGGARLPTSGSLIYVVVEEPHGGWRIASAQTTPITAP